MKRRKIGWPERIFNLVNLLICAIIMILCVYPFYYIFIYSISDPVQAQKGIYLLPRGFTLRSYSEVLKLKGIGGAVLVSVSRTILGTALTVFCSGYLAFLVTQKRVYCRKLIYRLVVATMYLNAGLIPWYITMKFLHLNNHFLVYIIPYAVSAYYVVLIKTFIEQLPPSLEESAWIDGAGIFQIFTRIILPLSKPIIATIAVFAAVNQWNQWFDNYILVQSQSLRTLQLILYNFLNESNSIASLMRAQNFSVDSQLSFKITPQAIKMTITMVITLPIICVYPFLQRFFVKGIMLGAVKG